MTEIELRFQVPAPERERLRRAVARGDASTQPLHSRYVDTADGRLAAAGMSLRLRRDGTRWWQTVKGPAEGVIARLEHEVPVAAPRRGLPAIDPARHDGTPAGPLLRALLGDGAALLPVFETEVQRTRRVLRVGASRIELALDEGWLRAGDHAVPLFELEFEWVAGPLHGLFTLADRWVARHGLWLEPRSKSARGAGLAAAETTAAVAPVRRPQLAPGVDADAALRAMVAAGLAHLLPVAAAVAAGSTDAEDLHQVRVALRRLRTALRLFGHGVVDVDAAWMPALAAVFDALGDARDRDALAASLLPALRAAGAPLAEWPARAGDAADPAQVLRDRTVNRLWLALMAFAAGAPAAGAEPLADRLRPLLRRLHRQLVRDGQGFLDADDMLRHRTRRRVKRLRYGVEFVASLFPAPAVRRYLKRLVRAQEALGRFNDLCVAQQAFRDHAAQDPQAWFAVGWLQAQRGPHIDDAARALRRLGRARPFWKR